MEEDEGMAFLGSYPLFPQCRRQAGGGGKRCARRRAVGGGRRCGSGRWPARRWGQRAVVARARGGGGRKGGGPRETARQRPAACRAVGPAGGDGLCARRRRLGGRQAGF
uniref:Uncharacterized protein n=1 Tax=Oryza rufipogon TaxID=4529 RepID=A0A0E0RAI7_ORYRU